MLEVNDRQDCRRLHLRCAGQGTYCEHFAVVPLTGRPSFIIGSLSYLPVPTPASQNSVIVGPIFSRELVTAPRRAQHYVARTAYVAALVVLMCTAWLLMTGTQRIRNVGDMARFGMALFQVLAPLQLALLTFLAAMAAASNVAIEKDRKTILLLLMTRLNNSELVLGKLMASLLEPLTMLLAALPVFVATTLFGGVSLMQVAEAYGITAAAMLAAGSLGNMLALWREKTFQTLAMTALGLVLWVAAGEGLLIAANHQTWGGVQATDWVTAFSPLRAILVASQPALAEAEAGWRGNAGAGFCGFGLLVAALLSGVAVWRVRIWNPSREARPQQPETSEQVSIWHKEDAVGEDVAREAMRRREAAEAARATHVDARVRAVADRSRPVWDNPILWRETCTWAYGRKVLLIRLAYLVLTALAAASLYYYALAPNAGRLQDTETVIPPAAQPLAPFFVLSLVIINALAVTAITNERDGGALDLLLVTDLSSAEFLLGKIGGVAYVTKEMIAAPLLLCVGLWWFRGMTLEDLTYCLGGLLVMDLFAIVLGIHCGMIYASSRQAIGISLGTVFFLFLGVVTLLVLMVSFSGSFERQLVPFLAFIVGGGVGLFVALGARNPSAAIATASFALPFATFFAITSFLLRQPLNVFLVTAAAYGLAIAAMMIPALSEFDFAMGRSKGGGE
jgi:ABC-type transport system involved in multi-copper enzyme maturation permease subunit